MQKILMSPYVLLALALVGIATTLYLSVSVYTGVAPSCLLEGCEKVLNSSYSKVFGVPLSYIGLVYYVYMLCLGFMLAIDPRSAALRLGALIYSTIGLLMSIFFIYIQGMLIGAWCQYCLISALLTLALFATSLWHWGATRGETA